MSVVNRKPSLMLVLAVVMLGLLAALATLQYRWLGQISQAEGERMKRTLNANAMSFSQDFDREITLAYIVFQFGHLPDESQDYAPQFAERFQIWKTSSANPQLIKDVYLVSKKESTNFQLSRFNAEQSKLETTEWTNELKPIQADIEATQERQEARIRAGEEMPEPILERMSPINPDIPALLIPVMPEFAITIGTPEPLQRVSYHGVSNFVMVKFDNDFIKNELIPTLSRKHFSGANGLDYNVSIFNIENQSPVYQSTSDSQQNLSSGDVNAPFFRIRSEEVPPVFLLREKQQSPQMNGTMIWESRVEKTTSKRPQEGKTTVRVVNRTKGADFTVGAFFQDEPKGLWILSVQHRAGSLEAFIASARRRNLLISFGILLLLAASVSLIVIATRRSQLLAQRQIEFVSAVSHEFRTPLAVICSAGENMADGIVESKPQVEKYGKLGLGEGRRLTAMVEQVLAFAGANRRRRQLEFRVVTVKEVINDALQACRPLLTEKDFKVETEIDSDFVIEADMNSLSRAIQNLLNNAIKYDGQNRWIRIKAFVDDNKEVVISVADKGRGIASDELKNIFEPFYRGKDAVAAQIHGNGLGLNLVKQTITEHKGRVSVTSKPGQGSKFSIHLPIASIDALKNEAMSQIERKVKAYSDGL